MTIIVCILFSLTLFVPFIIFLIHLKSEDKL